MKWSMFVYEGAMQINLEPENDHEREFVSILKKRQGEVSIHAAVNIGMCQGGYLRAFGEKQEALAITILPKESGNG